MSFPWMKGHEESIDYCDHKNLAKSFYGYEAQEANVRRKEAPGQMRTRLTRPPGLLYDGQD
jgi:hypothetical protein